MKLLIASDIHGDFDSLSKLIDIYNSGNFDRILILGDILYHGPRNDLPSGYAPKNVISVLNTMKTSILAVRGNCDTEVDQMVLEFPILADYAYLSLDGISVIATHGHKLNKSNEDLFREGEILLHGHTHIQCIEKFGKNNYYINPGSISIPKGGNPQTYAVYEDGKFSIIDFDGNVINEITIEQKVH